MKHIVCPHCNAKHDKPAMAELKARKDDKANLVFTCSCGTEFKINQYEYVRNMKNDEHVIYGTEPNDVGLSFGQILVFIVFMVLGYIGIGYSSILPHGIWYLLYGWWMP